MKSKINRSWKGKAPSFVALALAVLITGVSGADATIITLSDLNTTARIDPHTQSGMFDWTVDGVDHMFQQWFWFRVGSTAPEAAINTLDTLTNPVVETPFLGTRGLTTRYTNPGLFTAEITYTLTGGAPGSGRSDIGESIRITNLSSTSPLDFHFFQYTDFDIGGLANDTAERLNANTMSQFDPNFAATETVTTPAPSQFEVGIFAATRSRLNDTLATTLNGIPGPVTGDATFAWQWDDIIGPSGSFLISKNKSVTPVPEPATLLLLGSGVFGLGLWGRKRVHSGIKKHELD